MLSLVGFTAVIAQVVLMRELIVVFYGNELALGVMLACWLFWTALGSSFLGRFSGRLGDARLLMAALQILIAVTLPATILAVRASKLLFRPIPGELLGPGSMLMTSLATLSLFCIVSGWLFAAGSRLCAEARQRSVARATGSVYLLEAVGSGLGGLLVSIALMRYLTAFEIASILALLNILAASLLIFRQALHRLAIAGALAAACALIIFPWANHRLEDLSLAYLWRGFRLVATRNSIYGNLVITQTEGTRSLYENGLVVMTLPDPAAAEEAVHYALLQHPSPRSLLLIGGGLNGSVRQALQHSSLERVHYVELDPAVFQVAENYFPAGWEAVQTDARVTLHNVDGRRFIKETGATFDVIIVNLPDPQTAQLNRFYTFEFFREASEKLNPGGVISFQVTGAENYISPELAGFLRCLKRTLSLVFENVTVIPGASIHFFASHQAGNLTSDPAQLVERLRARRLRTTYVSEFFIPFRMMPDRMLDLESQIQPLPATPVNRDFVPTAYYFNVALWSSRFDQRYRRVFDSVAGIDIKKLAGALGFIGLGTAGLLAWRLRREARARATAVFCVGAMGFTLLALEILLLLGFQAIYGFVYHQLAILIAAFMVGMAWGSHQALRGAGANPDAENLPAVSRRLMRTLAALQVPAAVSGLLVYVLLGAFGRIHSPVGNVAVSQIGFPLLALLAGALGGYQFPVASRIYFACSQGKTASPGILYGVDLIGACVGALALSMYLLPVFGVLKAALIMAVVNLGPAVLAGSIVRGEGRQSVG